MSKIHCMKLSAKALGYAQAFVITIIVAAIIYAAVYYFSYPSIPWYSFTEGMVVVALSFLVCIALRELKIFAPKSTDATDEKIGYVLSGILAVVGAAIFIDATGKTEEITAILLMAATFCLALFFHMRYGVAVALIVTMLISLFDPYSGIEWYGFVFTVLVACTFAGGLLKFILFVDWKKYGSDRAKQESKNMTFVLTSKEQSS